MDGVKKGLTETTLHLQLSYTVDYPSYALVLAVAICFGTQDAQGRVQAVTYRGCGRIVRMV